MAAFHLLPWPTIPSTAIVYMQVSEMTYNSVWIHDSIEELADFFLEGAMVLAEAEFVNSMKKAG